MTADPTPEETAGRLAEVRGRIETAARAAGRDPAAVRLVAVSKRHPADAVEALRALGQRDFGESRQQELVVKAAAVADVRWHFVGRLQTNKARAVADVADVVHSLDRPGLVAALAKARRPLRVLVQVSLDGDPDRGGATPEDVRRLAERVRRDHPGAVEISAGMSGDLEDAVAEGATLVRVGTALFGAR